MIEIKIEGLDKLVNAGTQKAALIKRGANSALSTVGVEFTKVAKDAGYTGRNQGGYLGWDPLSPYTGTLALAKAPGRYKGEGGQWASPQNPMMRARQRYKRTARNYFASAEGQRMHRRWLSSRRNPYGKLINALRYKKLVDQGMITMGFIPELGARVDQLASLAARGFTISVNPRMRRFFFALHLPLTADKSHMVVPGRPFIGRVWKMNQDRMLALFNTKFAANLERYQSGIKKQ